LEYILSSLDTLDISSERDRGVIISFLNYSTCWQGADFQKRQIDQHIDMESNRWKQIYDYIVHTRYSRKRFAYLIATNKESLKIAFSNSITRLKVNTVKDNIRMDGIDYKVMFYKVSEEQVSYYNPVHWFLAQLLAFTSIENGDRLIALQTTGPDFKTTVLDVMEYPLQTVVLLAQVKAGMWVRNGETVLEQCNEYQRTLGECYDDDIFIIQLAAAYSDPDHFLISLIQRFEISRFFGQEPESTAISEINTLKLVESLLSLIIVVISERHRLVGVSREDELEREILHHLAASKQGMTLEEIYETCCPRLSKSGPM
jgi:hypothetical protein